MHRLRLGTGRLYDHAGAHARHRQRLVAHSLHSSPSFAWRRSLQPIRDAGVPVGPATGTFVSAVSLHGARRSVGASAAITAIRWHNSRMADRMIELGLARPGEAAALARMSRDFIETALARQSRQPPPLDMDT